MVKTLKKECVNSAVIAAVICAIIAVIALAVTGFQSFTLLGGPEKIEDGCDLEDYEGKYVEIECYGVLTEFMRLYTKYDDGREVLTDIGYLMIYVDDFENWENETYYGIVLPKKNEDVMDERMDAFWEFLSDDSDEMKYDKTFKVTGSVRALESREKAYYDDTVEEWEDALGTAALGVQYYVIDADYIGEKERDAVMIATVVAIIALAIAIICIVYAELCYDNAYKKFLKNHPNLTEAEIEADFQSAIKINKEWYKGRRFTFFVEGMTFRVLAQDEMVWAYYYKRTGRHAVSQVRVFTKNGSMTPINAAEARCHDYLELLDADYDHIIVGYSKDLEKMYKKQFNEFLELKYNPAMRGEMSNTYEASAEPTDPTL